MNRWILILCFAAASLAVGSAEAQDTTPGTAPAGASQPAAATTVPVAGVEATEGASSAPSSAPESQAAGAERSPLKGAIIGGVAAGALYFPTVPAQVILFVFGPLGWAVSLALLLVPPTVGWVVGTKLAQKRVPLLQGVLVPWLALLGGVAASVAMEVVCSPLSVIPVVGGILYMALVLGTPAVAVGAASAVMTVRTGRFKTVEETEFIYRDLAEVPESPAATNLAPTEQRAGGSP